MLCSNFEIHLSVLFSNFARSLLSAFSAYFSYVLSSGRQPGFALVLVFVLVDFILTSSVQH